MAIARVIHILPDDGVEPGPTCRLVPEVEQSDGRSKTVMYPPVSVRRNARLTGGND